MTEFWYENLEDYELNSEERESPRGKIVDSIECPNCESLAYKLNS